MSQKVRMLYCAVSITAAVQDSALGIGARIVLATLLIAKEGVIKKMEGGSKGNFR
jgi:hypothetical protein